MGCQCSTDTEERPGTMSNQAISNETSEDQATLRQFVDREVYYCVSGLIHHLVQQHDGEYSDEILSVCVVDDYESAAYEEGWRITDDDSRNGFVARNGENNTVDLTACTDEAEAWRELCEAKSIDPHTIEAYEHWLISDWLADKLAAHGEMVSKDIHGLTVWGRCTTGQSILLDEVIKDIYNELHAD